MLQKRSLRYFHSIFDLLALVAFKIATIALIIFTINCERIKEHCIDGAWWIASQGTVFAVIYWPLVMVAAGWTLLNLDGVPRRFKPRYLLAILPIYSIIFTALWGTLHWCDTTANASVVLPSSVQVINNVFQLTVGICLALTLMYEGHRRFFIGTFAIMWFLHAGVAFVSYMAVTGTWL